MNNIVNNSHNNLLSNSFNDCNSKSDQIVFKYLKIDGNPRQRVLRINKQEEGKKKKKEREREQSTYNEITVENQDDHKEKINENEKWLSRR